MFSKSLTKPEDRQVKPSDDGGERVRRPTRVPAVTVLDTEEAILVVADMPGVTQDQVEITVDQDLMTVRGTVPADTHDGFRLLHREYEAASFERTFTVPAEVDSQAVAATVKNGVLTVTLPKQKAVQPRRVTVKAG